MIAGDRNRVPIGKFAAAPGKNIGDDAHGRAKRIDVGAAGDVFLENVVLDGASEALEICALLFGDGDVEGEKDRGGGIDGHRSGDVLEGDAVEEGLHVFERIDGDADFSDFALRERVVGIHADLGGEIEGDGEAVDALGQEVAVALVRFDGGAEAGVLAGGPEAAAVHGGIDAAGERELAWVGEFGFGVPAAEGILRDDGFHRQACGRG